MPGFASSTAARRAPAPAISSGSPGSGRFGHRRRAPARSERRADLQLLATPPAAARRPPLPPAFLTSTSSSDHPRFRTRRLDGQPRGEPTKSRQRFSGNVRYAKHLGVQQAPTAIRLAARTTIAGRRSNSSLRFSVRECSSRCGRGSFHAKEALFANVRAVGRCCCS